MSNTRKAKNKRLREIEAWRAKQKARVQNQFDYDQQLGQYKTDQWWQNPDNPNKDYYTNKRGKTSPNLVANADTNTIFRSPDQLARNPDLPKEFAPSRVLDPRTDDPADIAATFSTEEIEEMRKDPQAWAEKNAKEAGVWEGLRDRGLTAMASLFNYEDDADLELLGMDLGGIESVWDGAWKRLTGGYNLLSIGFGGLLSAAPGGVRTLSYDELSAGYSPWEIFNSGAIGLEENAAPSPGQIALTSVGIEAARIRRGEGRLSDLALLNPATLPFVAAAYLAPDSPLQDKNFDIMDAESRLEAFASGPEKFFSGLTDTGLMFADPLIGAGVVAKVGKAGALGTQFSKSGKLKAAQAYDQQSYELLKEADPEAAAGAMAAKEAGDKRPLLEIAFENATVRGAENNFDGVADLLEKVAQLDPQSNKVAPIMRLAQQITQRNADGSKVVTGREISRRREFLNNPNADMLADMLEQVNDPITASLVIRASAGDELATKLLADYVNPAMGDALEVLNKEAFVLALASASEELPIVKSWLEATKKNMRADKERLNKEKELLQSRLDQSADASPSPELFRAEEAVARIKIIEKELATIADFDDIITNGDKSVIRKRVLDEMTEKNPEKAVQIAEAAQQQVDAVGRIISDELASLRAGYKDFYVPYRDNPISRGVMASRERSASAKYQYTMEGTSILPKKQVLRDKDGNGIRVQGQLQYGPRDGWFSSSNIDGVSRFRRNVRIWRWAGEENPVGYLGLKGTSTVGMEREVDAMLRNLDAYKGSKEAVARGQQLRNELIKSIKQGQVDGYEAVRVFERAVAEDIMRFYGLADELAAANTDPGTVAQAVIQRAQTQRDEIFQRLSNKDPDQKWWTDPDGGFEYSPFLEAQAANGTMVVNFDELQKALKKVGSDTSLQNKWRQSMTVGADVGVETFNKLYGTFNNLWRPATLLRASYTQRNVFEGSIRAMAYTHSLRPLLWPAQAAFDGAYNLLGVNKTRSAKAVAKARKRLDDAGGKDAARRASEEQAELKREEQGIQQALQQEPSFAPQNLRVTVYGSESLMSPGGVVTEGGAFPVGTRIDAVNVSSVDALKPSDDIGMSPEIRQYSPADQDMVDYLNGEVVDQPIELLQDRVVRLRAENPDASDAEIVALLMEGDDELAAQARRMYSQQADADEVLAADMPTSAVDEYEAEADEFMRLSADDNTAFESGSDGAQRFTVVDEGDEVAEEFQPSAVTEDVSRLGGGSEQKFLREIRENNARKGGARTDAQGNLVRKPVTPPTADEVGELARSGKASDKYLFHTTNNLDVIDDGLRRGGVAGGPLMEQGYGEVTHVFLRSDFPDNVDFANISLTPGWDEVTPPKPVASYTWRQIGQDPDDLPFGARGQEDGGFDEPNFDPTPEEQALVDANESKLVAEIAEIYKDRGPVQKPIIDRREPADLNLKGTVPRPKAVGGRSEINPLDLEARPLGEEEIGVRATPEEVADWEAAYEAELRANPDAMKNIEWFDSPGVNVTGPPAQVRVIRKISREKRGDAPEQAAIKETVLPQQFEPFTFGDDVPDPIPMPDGREIVFPPPGTRVQGGDRIPVPTLIYIQLKRAYDANPHAETRTITVGAEKEGTNAVIAAIANRIGYKLKSVKVTKADEKSAVEAVKAYIFNRQIMDAELNGTKGPDPADFDRIRPTKDEVRREAQRQRDKRMRGSDGRDAPHQVIAFQGRGSAGGWSDGVNAAVDGAQSVEPWGLPGGGFRQLQYHMPTADSTVKVVPPIPVQRFRIEDGPRKDADAAIYTEFPAWEPPIGRDNIERISGPEAPSVARPETYDGPRGPRIRRVEEDDPNLVPLTFEDAKARVKKAKPYLKSEQEIDRQARWLMARYTGRGGWEMPPYRTEVDDGLAIDMLGGDQPKTPALQYDRYPDPEAAVQRQLLADRKANEGGGRGTYPAGVDDITGDWRPREATANGSEASVETFPIMGMEDGIPTVISRVSRTQAEAKIVALRQRQADLDDITEAYVDARLEQVSGTRFGKWWKANIIGARRQYEALRDEASLAAEFVDDPGGAAYLTRATLEEREGYERLLKLLYDEDYALGMFGDIAARKRRIGSGSSRNADGSFYGDAWSGPFTDMNRELASADMTTKQRLSLRFSTSESLFLQAVRGNVEPRQWDLNKPRGTRDIADGIARNIQTYASSELIQRMFMSVKNGEFDLDEVFFWVTKTEAGQRWYMSTRQMLGNDDEAAEALENLKLWAEGGYKGRPPKLTEVEGGLSKFAATTGLDPKNPIGGMVDTKTRLFWSEPVVKAYLKEIANRMEYTTWDIPAIRDLFMRETLRRQEGSLPQVTRNGRMGNLSPLPEMSREIQDILSGLDPDIKRYLARSKGEEVTMPQKFLELNPKLADTDPRHYWVLADETLRSSTRKVQDIYSRMVGGLFNFLGTMPEDAFVRMPFYNRQFKLTRDDLIRDYWDREFVPTSAELKAIGVSLEAFQKAQKSKRKNAAAKLVAESQGVKNEVRIPLKKLRAIEVASHRQALADTRQWLYTIERRTNLGKYGEYAFPFISATQNSVNVIGKLLQRDPWLGPLAVDIWRAPQKLGIEDDEGNIVLPIPQKVKENSVFKDVLGIDENSNIKFNKGGLNTLSPETGYGMVPRMGPIQIMPASEAMKAGLLPVTTPKIIKTILGDDGGDWFYGEFKKYMFGEEGSYSEEFASWDKMMPGWIQKGKNRGDAMSAAYGYKYNNAYIREWNNYYTGQRDEAPSGDELNEIVQSQFFFDVIGAIGIPTPATPYPILTPPKIDTPEEVLQDLVRAYFDQADRSDPMSNPGGDFQDKFGYLMATGARSTTSTGMGGIAPQLVAVEDAKRFSPLIDEVSDNIQKDNYGVLGMITNMRATRNDYDRNARTWQKLNPIPGKGIKWREDLSPDEQIQESQRVAGWVNYRSRVDALEAQLFDRGLRNFQQRGAEDLRATKKQLVTDMTENPLFTGWTLDYEDAGKGKTVAANQTLRLALADDEFKDFMFEEGMQNTWKAMDLYVETRNRVGNFLNGVEGGIDKPENRKVKEFWEGFQDELRMSDDRWSEMFDLYLSSDTDPAQQTNLRRVINQEKLEAPVG